jgi:hypothetical protein
MPFTVGREVVDAGSSTIAVMACSVEFRSELRAFIAGRRPERFEDVPA